MTTIVQLQVRVNKELVLDAGTCEELSGPNGPELLIRPPQTTLFHQVLAYLRAKPDPPVRTEGISRISDEEMARINIEASAALAEPGTASGLVRATGRPLG